MMILDRLFFSRFKRPAIAVIRLHGVIGPASTFRRSLSLQAIERRLDAVFNSRRLKAVALSINSPGGSPVQSELVAKRICTLANEKDVPVYSFIEDVGASGGYWLACAGDEIFAHSSSIVGSIGVISGGFGFAELIKKYGIERRLYTSGEKKAMNDPFSPEKLSDIKHLKSIQREIHEDFVNIVKQQRGKRLSGKDRTLFSGAYWTGKQALKLGLIDGIGDLRGVMREKFGDDLRFKVFDENRSWVQRKLSVRPATLPDIGGGPSFGKDLIDAFEERLWWNRFGF